MTRSIHDSRLEAMAKDPDKEICLPDVMTVRMDLPIYKHLNYDSDTDHDSPIHKGPLLTEIDILFELKNGLYIIGEYKCNDTRLARFKAQNQLILGSKGLSKHPYKIGVSHMGYIWGEGDTRGVDELIEHDGHYSWNEWMRNGKRI